jgi:hypothetical protein
MDLQEKMSAKKKDFESSAPKEVLEIMNGATEALKKSGIMNRVKRKGDLAPDFSLKDAYGKTLNLKDRLSETPVVLGFYRGRW